LTPWRESLAGPGGVEPDLKPRPPHDAAVQFIQFKGLPMKSLIALTAIAIFTVTVAVAGKPPAFATDKATAAAKSKPVMMAEQQLPFERGRSKN
jgi:hypothetical protein